MAGALLGWEDGFSARRRESAPSSRASARRGRKSRGRVTECSRGVAPLDSYHHPSFTATRCSVARTAAGRAQVLRPTARRLNDGATAPNRPLRGPTSMAPRRSTSPVAGTRSPSTPRSSRSGRSTGNPHRCPPNRNYGDYKLYYGVSRLAAASGARGHRLRTSVRSARAPARTRGGDHLRAPRSTGRRFSIIPARRCRGRIPTAGT